jgi:tetratricopeptide (TPR) repeat protein
MNKDTHRNRGSHQKLNLWVSSIVFVVALGMAGCQETPVPAAYDYGTASDPARRYYHQGWEQIMDFGLWTEAERSFRKAVETDPDFIIGKSLVARISSNLEERLELQREIESRISEVDANGLLVLNVFLRNIQAMNLRGQGKPLSEEFNKDRKALAISNFNAFLEIYPDDTYIMAEYVEWIHRADGAQAALATIRQNLTPGQRETPFFVRYAAALNAELGNHDRALSQARDFAAMLDNPDLPEQYVLYAEIYHRTGRLDAARENIDKAVELDPRHLIASGLQSQIQQEMRQQ